ncbi:MAG: alpha/beta hydrolase fold domain-containing protein [Chitinivibrionales bacterium]|nr:alpha/beta hydrolase fold domain-containing protein [Chitinivibrionales bacterium]
MQSANAKRDILYGNPQGFELRGNLYSPAAASVALPAIVCIHGGGFTQGSKDDTTVNAVAEVLIRHNFVCFAIDYRLAPDARFPAAIEDCMCAVRFLRANAAKLGIRKDFIGAWGASAGGYLAAMLGTTGKQRVFRNSGGWSHESSEVTAVCDWFGPTDFSQLTIYSSSIDRNLPDAPEAQFLGCPINQNLRLVQRANPIAYVNASNPPFLIIHGDQDTFVPLHQSRILAAALSKAGVCTTMHVHAGRGHGDGFFDNPDILQMTAGFFRNHSEI